MSDSSERPVDYRQVWLAKVFGLRTGYRLENQSRTAKEETSRQPQQNGLFFPNIFHRDDLFTFLSSSPLVDVAQLSRHDCRNTTIMVARLRVHSTQLITMAAKTAEVLLT